MSYAVAIWTKKQADAGQSWTKASLAVIATNREAQKTMERRTQPSALCSKSRPISLIRTLMTSAARSVNEARESHHCCGSRRPSSLRILLWVSTGLSFLRQSRWPTRRRSCRQSRTSNCHQSHRQRSQLLLPLLIPVVCHFLVLYSQTHPPLVPITSCV